MSHFFISYSRADKPLALELADRLKGEGRERWIDLEGIPPSVEWLEEIKTAIEGAAAVVFLLSSDSAKSEVCRQELEMALEFGKRVIPVLVRATEPALVQTEVRQLQWIDSTTPARREEAFRELLEAADTDFDWVHLHTRLLRRAREWEGRDLDRSLLLRGKDLQAIQTSLDVAVEREPSLTELQLRYLSASEQFEKRRKRNLIAASAIGLVVALGLSIWAISQWREAGRQRDTAETRRITSYWEEGRRARSDGKLLEAAHWMAEAIDVAPASELAPRIYVDLAPLLTRARLDRRCGVGESTVPFPGPDRLLVSRGSSTNVIDTRACEVLAESKGDVFAVDRERNHAVAMWGSDDSVFGLGFLAAEGARSISYELEEYPVSLNRIRFSSDPRTFAGIFYVERAEVRVWRAEGDRLEFRAIAEPENGQFDGLSFSADGTTLLVWGDAFHLYDVGTLEPIRSAFGEAFRVADAVVSPDREWILSISDQQMALLWSVGTGQPATTPRRLPFEIEGTCGGRGLDLEWIDTNTLSLGRDCDGRQLKLEVNLEAGSESRWMPLFITDEDARSRFRELARHERWIDPLVPGGTLWYFDDKREAVADGRIWRTAPPASEAPRVFTLGAGREPVRDSPWPTVPPAADMAVRFNRPGDTRMAEHGRAFLRRFTGGVELWTDRAGGEPVTTLAGPWTGATTSLDGKTALAWAGRAVSVWDASEGPLARVELDREEVAGAALVPGRTAFVTWSGDGSEVWVWDYGGDTPVGAALHLPESSKVEGPVYGVDLSPDGRRLLTWTRGWDDGYVAGVRVWDLDGVQEPLDITGVWRGAFTPDSSRVIVWGWDGMAAWDLDQGERAWEKLSGQRLSGVVLSADGERGLTWHEGSASLWDLAVEQPVGPSLSPPHLLYGAVLLADGRYAAFWGAKTASLWDLMRGEQVGSSLESDEGFCGMYLSEDGGELLVLECDGTIRRWPAWGDVDLPLEVIALQTRALTGVRLDFDGGTVRDLTEEELTSARTEWLARAHEHAESCRFPDQNLYLRWFPSSMNGNPS